MRALYSYCGLVALGTFNCEWGRDAMSGAAGRADGRMTRSHSLDTLLAVTFQVHISREETMALEDRDHLDLSFTNAVDDSIGADDHLSQVRKPELRHDAAAERQQCGLAG